MVGFDTGRPQVVAKGFVVGDQCGTRLYRESDNERVVLAPGWNRDLVMERGGVSPESVDFASGAQSAFENASEIRSQLRVFLAWSVELRHVLGPKFLVDNYGMADSDNSLNQVGANCTRRTLQGRLLVARKSVRFHRG